MKSKLALLSLLFTAHAFAGDNPSGMQSDCECRDTDTTFDLAIRPITNPTLFELAAPRTQVHAIYMRQSLPSRVSLAGGGKAPLDGDFDLYALQLEYAFNERFSFIANKDGYIDFNPDNTLSEQEGFANLGLGVKYAMIYRPESQYILSGTATVEVPTGESEVWQGNGDGALNLSLTGLKLYDRLQLAGATGLHIPFNDSESLTGFSSAHFSYHVNQWFIPLIEVNWYHVFDEGDGTFAFQHQGEDLISSAAAFEGGDLINLGSANAKDNRDIVTLGFGFRSNICDSDSIGCAYEIPLTDEEDNLLDNRLTFDLVWRF